MFRNDLFTQSYFENVEEGFRTIIVFNWEHPVFKGHFPSKPVVPGVLLMQTVKECFEEFSGIVTDLLGADLKFTSPVTPETAGQVTIEVSVIKEDDGRYKIRSTGYSGELRFFKINMELVQGGL
jgi:3-hydroxyacyl-[acyl-carrier-protein] dehydratase